MATTSKRGTNKWYADDLAEALYEHERRTYVALPPWAKVAQCVDELKGLGFPDVRDAVPHLRAARKRAEALTPVLARIHTRG